MPLSEDQKRTINRLSAKIRSDARHLGRLNLYYNSEQVIRHIGMAVQPELRDFTTIVNIPRIVVDEPTLRQNVRGFYRAGDSTREDSALREAYEANNLASELPILQTEQKIFGRAYASVGANPDDPEHPLITVEDPRAFGVDVDQVSRKITAAARLYRDDENRATVGTLYERGMTVHIQRGRNGWEVADREDPVDEHGLGVVPIIGFINRRRAGSWTGLTEMADAITKTDTVARIITNMSVAADTLALPHRWASGLSKEDFIDSKTGKPLPVFEAYMSAIMATANPEAKFGSFTTANLDNFHKAVDAILSWAAAEYGLPLRYMGQQTVNPAAEGAIRADESRLIGRVERMNRADGDALAWVMDLYERFRTGEWGPRNSIRVLWHDPATPTLSQIADAAMKMRAAGALSVEGVWDMLGWDAPRMQQERDRLDREAADPTTMSLLAEVRGARNGNGALPAAAGGDRGSVGGGQAVQ